MAATPPRRLADQRSATDRNGELPDVGTIVGYLPIVVVDDLRLVACHSRTSGGLDNSGTNTQNWMKHCDLVQADLLEQTGVRLGPGTLYGALTKLEERGLIRALPNEDRRRPYEITAAGRTALEAQLATWSRVVQTGRTRLSPA